MRGLPVTAGKAALYTSAPVKRLFHKAFVFCLAAWLPLQAVALPALVLDCELDPQGSSLHQAMHGGAQHDHESDAPAHDHDGDAGHDALGHGCCHNLSSGAAASPPVVSLQRGGVVPSAPAVHPYRFFPDLPKRPPLADLV
jgi:hypothetical protein